jgi:hypothetical protein
MGEGVVPLTMKFMWRQIDRLHGVSETAIPVGYLRLSSRTVENYQGKKLNGTVLRKQSASS